MKIIINTVFVLSLTLLINAQSINVHKNDGTVQSFTLSGIDSITFTGSEPSPCPISISYSGKIYNTIQIGTQCWLKENLDVGIRINGDQNGSDNGVIEKYCYGNDPANCNAYGGFYRWNEVMQYKTASGIQGICPSGWHVPTLSELQALVAAVGNNSNALKLTGQGTGSGAGTNESGFSALLAGTLTPTGFFENLGNYGTFWSSTEYNSTNAFILTMNFVNNDVESYSENKEYGFNVRCLKD